MGVWGANLVMIYPLLARYLLSIPRCGYKSQQYIYVVIIAPDITLQRPDNDQNFSHQTPRLIGRQYHIKLSI